MTSQVTLSSYAIIVTRKSWVMGQFTDGSDWLWLTKRDRSPLLALSHIATANTSKPVQNEIVTLSSSLPSSCVSSSDVEG